MSITGLFIGNNSSVYSIFATIGVARMNCKLDQGINFKEAKDLIEIKGENHYGFLIICLPLDGAPDFLNFLTESGHEVPILFTADENTLQKVHALLPLHPLTSRICFNMGEKVISNALRRLVKVKQKHLRSKESFCPLPIAFFSKLKKASFDTYIKLSEDKYLLLFRKGLPFDIERIKQYELRSCQYLYLKDSDYLEASSNIFDKIAESVKPKELEINKLSSLVKLSGSIVHKTIINLGIREESLKIADFGITAMKELVAKADKNLSKHIKNILKGSDFKSELSLLSIFIATAIAKELDMISNETRNKIVCAFFFCDIATEDLELLKSEDPDKADGVISRRLKDYLAHPQNAVAHLNQVNNLPMDIDRLIMIHHEKPDGSGFPKGLDWKKMFPLGAIIILSHELSKIFCCSGVEESFIEDIFEDFETHYNKGNYKLALEGAKKAFGIRLNLPYEKDDEKEAS